VVFFELQMQTMTDIVKCCHNEYTQNADVGLLNKDARYDLWVLKNIR